MTSKERVRNAIMRLPTDKIPADFACVPYVGERLLKKYNFSEFEQVYEKFDIDIRSIEPDYIGPKLKEYYDNNQLVHETYWGSLKKMVWTGKEYHWHTFFRPLDECKTVRDVDNYKWPSTEWFDYESVKSKCDKYRDKAIITGHPGPFQVATTDLRNMEKLFIDMVQNPEVAHRIYDKMVEFELEYYERIMIAADGQIDILRPHDDYGTQDRLLFSPDMWKDYFAENTGKLAELAHKYNAFYMQHSCGAIRPVIPELIKCGVDILEPIQKVRGMEPEELKKEFGDKLAFHGGIDTQGLLPNGSTEDVVRETKYYIDTLGANGGYILMASQGFEGDVPVENIEAMYSVRG